MKQTEVSLSSAESEVQALASTEVLADYIKILRESTDTCDEDHVRQHSINCVSYG